MARLLAIEIAGPDKRVRRLHLDDGDDDLLTSASVVRSLGLLEGDEVVRTELAHALRAVGLDCARERALALLGYRDRSVHELRRKLAADGYDDEIAGVVVERLLELQLLDDREFATRWASGRRTAGYGPSRIRQELREKGVTDVVIADVLGTEDDETLVRRARRLLRDGDTADSKSRQRAYARLARRGYPPSVISRALESAVEDTYE